MDAPLSAQEQALWLLQRVTPKSGVSNVGVAAASPERLQLQSMNQAFGWVIGRHELLRSHYPVINDAPCRRTGEPASARLDSFTVPAHELRERMRDYAAAPFDLTGGIPIRLAVFDSGGRSHLCLVAHHIVVDHFTLRLVLEELLGAYQRYASGAVPEPLPAPTPAAPAVPPSEKAMNYWRNHINGLEAASMELSGSRRITGVPTFAGGFASFDLPSDLLTGPSALRRRLRGAATPNIILLSAYYLLLLREGAGPDLVTGVMLDGRRSGRDGHAGLGYRINTVPLRVRANPEAGFADLVTRVRRVFVGALEHPGVSYEMLSGTVNDATGTGAELWRSRYFRHLFNFRPRALGVGDQIAAQDMALSHVDTGFARFDLELTVDVLPDLTTLQLVYSTEVHDPGQAAAYLERYGYLLRQALADPDKPLRLLDTVTATDRAVLNGINQTARRWKGPTTVLGLVRERARKAPQSPAVTAAGSRKAVSGAQLTAAAALVRSRLLAQGVGPGDVVAVAGPRDASTAAALLGVWAAGAVQLPCDESLPAARLAFQFADSGCRTVIGGDRLPAELREGLSSIDVPDPSAVPPGSDALDDIPEPSGDSTAYVLYTSGSTGRPKGVGVTHRGLANVIRHFAAVLETSSDDAMPWLTTMSFDISALELWLPLVSGGRVIPAPDEARSDPGAFFASLTDGGATIVQATPTTWRLLVSEAEGRLSGLRVLCGGESLSRPLARSLLDEGARLFNVYGPTETTIWSTATEITDAQGEIGVGRPIANTTVHVLDEDLRELPPGVPGELCIGGDGLGTGYLGLPEQTAAAFKDAPGLGRIYRTGDIARLRRDGELELIGRKDRQVKLRAHRIELGEVEVVLEEHPSVRAAAVVLSEPRQGEPRLAAYVTTRENGLDTDELWRHTAERLPPYAVPSLITVLDALPENSSGKVDHRELASMDCAPAVRRAHRAGESGPRDPMTLGLVELWRTTLGVPEVHADSNFFLSGGQSLLAVRLAQQATDLCRTEIDLQDIFLAPTPAQLARYARGRHERERAGEAAR